MMKIYVVTHHDSIYEACFNDAAFESKQEAISYLKQIVSKLLKEDKRTRSYIIDEIELKLDRNGIFKSFFDDLAFRSEMQRGK